MFHNFLGMFDLPPIYPKTRGFKMSSDFFQNHSKGFMDTSLYIIKCLKCKMFHKFLGILVFHLPPIYPKIQGFKMWSNFFQSHSKYFIDTSLHITKCLKCKVFHNLQEMFHLPPIYPKIRGFKMWSDFFQSHSKYFIDTSLHITKCLKCKMFHNLQEMFHLPPIYPKIRDFKMWSDFFQSHSKYFIDTSPHIIKCLKCKMFHNFLRMFHLPPIFPFVNGR
jgi:hypothetical protein